MTHATPRLVLFGDSILDNASYTSPAPDSTAHLQRLLNGWTVPRLARDGATMAAVQFQLGQLRSRASVAVLSVGGNDALEHLGLLTHASTSSGALLGQLLNDRIIRTASRLGVDVLDLRSVCTYPADFVLQIEPSAQGAKKIAQAIAGVVSGGAGLTTAAVFSA